jgi:hypothetical protein
VMQVSERARVPRSRRKKRPLMQINAPHGDDAPAAVDGAELQAAS